MKLKLSIEPQQDVTLHHSARDILWVAAGAESLQDAADILAQRLNPACWSIHHGGHHVAVHWESGASRKADSVRVAMISEVRYAAPGRS